MGKHFAMLGFDIWDRDIIGHTWAIIALTGFLGAVLFDLILLLPLNLLILTAVGNNAAPAYGFYQMLPLYGLMSLCGFWWGLQFGFDAYYPRAKARFEARTTEPAMGVLQPLVVEVKKPR
ncbi:MAG: hypothetical protein LYZ69_06390 [Nitrososphaerales archaeon]|nr:hypothetical protein [Nitrososphaerales archaeon]